MASRNAEAELMRGSRRVTSWPTVHPPFASLDLIQLVVRLEQDWLLRPDERHGCLEIQRGLCPNPTEAITNRRHQIFIRSKGTIN
jgi:hypothetical protein